MSKGSGDGRAGVVFDLDGTLLDTLQDIGLAANQALQELGETPLPLEAYRLLVGEGVVSLMRRALAPSRPNEARIRQGVQAFERHYQQFWDRNTRPYPGMEALLDELQRRAIPMAVLSNKPHAFTCLCVERLLRPWRFVAVLGASEGLARKPDPAGLRQVLARMGLAPSRVLYLGDTAIDMETATRGGCYPVGVLWGFREARELRDAGARVLISAPGEVLSLLP